MLFQVVISEPEVVEKPATMGEALSLLGALALAFVAMVLAFWVVIVVGKFVRKRIDESKNSKLASNLAGGVSGTPAPEKDDAAGGNYELGNRQN